MKRVKDIITLRREADRVSSTLPALLVQAEKVANGIMHGEHNLRKAGSGEKFWQFREYEQHDRPQDIDWRQSAKSSQIYIRQKEWQIAQRTYFWCSSGKGMGYCSDPKTLHTKSEAARIITLALAMLMARNNEQVGIFGNRRTGRSDAKIQKIAQELLAGSKLDENLPPSGQFSLPQNSSLVLVGDFLSPIYDIEDNFSLLSAETTSALVVQILDPQEMELNFEGRVIFRSPDGKNSETINNVASVRDQYQERVKNHIKSIYELCSQRDWNYILHRTDHDISDTVMDIWTMIGSQQEKHGSISQGLLK